MGVKSLTDGPVPRRYCHDTGTETRHSNVLPVVQSVSDGLGSCPLLARTRQRDVPDDTVTVWTLKDFEVSPDASCLRSGS